MAVTTESSMSLTTTGPGAHLHSEHRRCSLEKRCCVPVLEPHLSLLAFASPHTSHIRSGHSGCAIILGILVAAGPS